MRLTEAQKEGVNQMQKHLVRQIGEREVTIEDTAAAMMELCENLDYDIAVSVCRRIWQGAGELYRLCEERDAIAKPDYAEYMLDRITERMGREQKKGFFLLALDSFDKKRVSAAETAARAALPEEKLKKMLSDRMREFSEDVIFHMKRSLREACFQKEDEDKVLKCRAAKEDTFLFAVAVYLAGLNGILPQVFGEYPELLGICSAAQMVIFQYCSDWKEEEEPEFWKISGMISGVICTVVGVVFVFASSVVGIAAETMLFVMECGQIGFLIGLFCSTAFSLLLVTGGVLLTLGVSAVLTECLRRFDWEWEKNKDEMAGEDDRDRMQQKKEADEEELAGQKAWNYSF